VGTQTDLSEGLSRNFVQIGYHVCTDEDYDEFFPPSNGYDTSFERQKKAKGLFCLDPFPIEIWGNNDATQFEHQRLDLNFLPCQLNTKNETCSSTLQQQIEYLGPV
jgi:hypothetical protein